MDRQGRYPLSSQPSIRRNLRSNSQLKIHDLELNGEVSEAELTIPPDMLAAYRVAKPASLDDLPFGTGAAIDVVLGLTIVSGAWEVT